MDLPVSGLDKKNPLVTVNQEEYEIASAGEVKGTVENVRFAWRPLETSHRLQDQIHQFTLFVSSPPHSLLNS